MVCFHISFRVTICLFRLCFSLFGAPVAYASTSFVSPASRVLAAASALVVCLFRFAVCLVVAVGCVSGFLDLLVRL